MCAYALNSSPEYLAFWEFLGGVLEHILSREFIVSLGDTVNASHGLAISNTMFDHMYLLLEPTLGQQSMIDFGRIIRSGALCLGHSGEERRTWW